MFYIYIYIFSSSFSSFSISLLSTNSFWILGVDGNPMLGARTYTPNPCHIWTRIYRASGYLQTHHVPVLTPCSWACPPCAPAYPPCEPAWAPCTPVCPPCEPAWVYFYRVFISSGFRVINFWTCFSGSAVDKMYVAHANLNNAYHLGLTSHMFARNRSSKYA